MTEGTESTVREEPIETALAREKEETTNETEVDRAPFFPRKVRATEDSPVVDEIMCREGTITIPEET